MASVMQDRCVPSFLLPSPLPSHTAHLLPPSAKFCVMQRRQEMGTSLEGGNLVLVKTSSPSYYLHHHHRHRHRHHHHYQHRHHHHIAPTS